MKPGKLQAIFEKMVFVTSVCALGATLCGTKACQEDYFFAQNSSVQGTTTPTATPTDDNGTTSASSSSTLLSATSSSGSSSSGSSSSSSESSESSGASTAGQINLPLLKELQNASENDPKKPGAPSQAKVQAGASGQNWLGNLYNEKGAPDESIMRDSDGDGFTDALEDALGSNSHDPKSIPQITGSRTSLEMRMRGIDDDHEGLTNSEEQSLGSNPNVADSDGDGVNDGAEALSGSDPLDASDRPIDRDGDGLGDDYERSVGLNAASPDTDGDGLRDDIELAIGSNPLLSDSDRDGIVDGKEVAQGSDPMRPEPSSPLIK